MDYTYIFSDVTDQLADGRVQILDHRNNQQQSVQVAIDDRGFRLRKRPQMRAVIADLIDLALTVYVADRLSIRRKDQPCQLLIKLPLRHPEVFKSSAVEEELKRTLFWYTGDYWLFEFGSRTALSRPVEAPLLLPSFTEYTEVALWSGGLDALAGLLYRIFTAPQSPTRYTLFGTGGNPYIHGIQQQVAATARAALPASRQIELVRVPIHLGDSKNIHKNANVRARGFVFLLLGSVCAYLEGQSSLHIYENGIGAINLPFRTAELGLTHTRSVHPLSLLQMSEFVSHVLSEPFTFQNPFLFMTKAQMCEALAWHKAEHVAFTTVSCDRRHRERPVQCGCCSSCILRQQSLAVQGIEDQTPYVINTYRRAHRPADGVHWQAMLYQVAKLRSLLDTAKPWYSLCKEFTTLFDIANRMAVLQKVEPHIIEEQLLQLYARYVHEWDSVKSTVERQLLANRETPDAA